MVLRIAGLPVWSPTDMIAGARAVVGWTDEAIGMVAALPDRVSGLLDDVDALLARITDVADRVDAIVGHADGIVGRIDPLLTDVGLVAEGAAALVARADVVAEGAAGLVARAGDVADSAAVVVAGAGAVAGNASGVIEKATSVADRAGTLVEEASATSRTAHELLGVYGPIAARAAPLARQFVDELSHAEVAAAIRLIDQLPLFTEHMETDIMPILATLDRVGPDVHELLDVLKEVRQAINGIPGFNFLRRRGEREDAAEER